MPKLNKLLNSQLKKLLENENLDTTGNKAEMVNRLTIVWGTDEIDQETLDETFPEHRAANEMAELKRMLASLTQTVTVLSDQVKVLHTSPTTSQNATNADKTSQNAENIDETNNSEEEENDVQINDAVSNVSVPDSNENAQQRQPVRHRYFSVKEISETIPTYDPTDESSVSAEQFVSHVNEVRSAYQWEETSLLLAVYSKLKGAARMWLNCRRTMFVSWLDFKSALLDEFGESFDEAEISSKMKNATRRNDEKFIDYCFRIHSLGKRFDLSEAAIIRFAREGLKHREFQVATATTKFLNMKQFRETLSEFLVNMPTSLKQTKDFYPTKTNNFTKTTGKREPMDQAKTSNDFSCYNCSEKGHISRNCPKPQKKERCTVCQRTTHKSENCPDRPMNLTKRSTINNIADWSETYDEVVKKIKVNNEDVSAFVDSGSPTSLIQKHLCLKFEKSVLNCSKKLKGFAGGIYTVTKLLPATVNIDGNDFETKLLVVEDGDIPEDVLIGRDLLCQKGNRMILERGNCRLERADADSVAKIDVVDENDELKQILEENRMCIAEDLVELGKCSVEKMQIELTSDTPINLKPYRTAFAKRELTENIVKDLLNCGIIRPSKSHYASPVVIVSKKNGESRLCVDYRCLNKITKRIPFPMPNLNEQFALLSGNHYFTTLDLRMGYHQIEMAEESKQFTAFVTTNGHYEYERMPFGLVNAPAVFQRVMNTIASEMSQGEVLVYLDDVIIPSETVAEGLTRLRKFLKLLIKHGLTLRYDKCKFLATEIEYLGHIVSGDGIRPGLNKITAIKNFKTPNNITEIRRFLGLTGFFRKFVQDYAIITKPITKLLKKDHSENFKWTDEQQNAFRKLIHILSNPPLLALYDVNKHHEVHTDACAIGLAGVLLQSADEKNWQPVMYFSRHCTPAEQNYHSYELEVLAIVESLERFRLYLLGKRFRIVTDCSAVVKVKAESELKPRISRWWLRMQEYDYDIVHRPGARLAHVDAMSRAPTDTAESCVGVGDIYTLSDQQSDWVVAMQQRDERARQIVNILQNKIESPEATTIKRDYEIDGGRLFLKTSDGRKFYVPKAVRWSLIHHYHDEMGHFSVERTLKRLNKFFWFPKMRKLVKEYVGSCINCCYHKSQRNKPEGELHCDDPTPLPFRVLHVDHLGPFVKSTKGNAYLIVITDAFSKFCIVKAVKNTKTGPVINLLKDVISYFGLPNKLISDRGTAFTSMLFAKFCQKNNIRHVKTAVRTPRANGQVERSNATILDAIRTSTPDSKYWDEKLEQLQWVLNSQPNATTRFTPNELVFSYNLNDVVQNNLVAAISANNGEQSTKTASEKRQMAAANIQNEQIKWKKRFDKKHTKPTQYDEGDMVVIKHVSAATGESRKLEPKYRGPYRVAKCLGNDRYVIKDVTGLQMTNKAFDSVYSSDHMKPWCKNYPEFLDNEDYSDYSSEAEDEEADAGADLHANEIPDETAGTAGTSGTAELSD